MEASIMSSTANSHASSNVTPSDKSKVSSRARAATPSPKASTDTKIGIENKDSPVVPKKPVTSRLRIFITRLPPQLCTLALGINGANAVLLQWIRILGLKPQDEIITVILPMIALSLLAAFAVKVASDPRAAIRDASEPATLSALSAAPAVTQAIAVRFNSMLPLEATQAVVVTCECLSLLIAFRFLWLNYNKGMRPDPSWFPAVLLWGMTNITSHAVGPDWLRNIMPAQFWLLVIIYIPLKIIVVYRILISKIRRTVTPNAGMNTLMAPASFYAMVHFSTGKPGGDLMGGLLFIDSTVFIFITACLLYVRRDLWVRTFHPSYVAFTFPTASTAVTAVLAAERLPYLQGSLADVAWKWAALLAVSAVAISISVFIRFMWHLQDTWKSLSTQQSKED